MSLIINYTSIPNTNSLLFSVVSGVSSSLYASFEWYKNNILVSTQDTYILDSPLPSDYVYVKIKDYATGCPVYWYDGNFYGGTFTGNFSGGTFHYGYLNGAQYTEISTKPKPFIKPI